MKKKEIFYFSLSILFIIFLNLAAGAEKHYFELWLDYKVKGNYGDVPQQPLYLEKGYWWWKEGTLGYWENSLSFTGTGRDQISRDFPVEYNFELGTVSDRDRRDFEVWTDNYSPAIKMKQANVKLSYNVANVSDNIYLIAGKKLLSFPLFFKDRVYAGIAGYEFGFPAKSPSSFKTEITWYQIMAYEGKYIEEDINFNDDIDLQGGSLSIQYFKDKYSGKSIIPEALERLYSVTNYFYLFKLTDAGNGRLGSDVNIAGYELEFNQNGRRYASFAYCKQQGDYYGYELDDYLYRYRFGLIQGISLKSEIQCNASYLGRGLSKDFNLTYSFFDFFEEPDNQNYLFKPHPGMVDRLSFQLIYNRKFDTILYAMSAGLLYSVYNFNNADFNKGNELNFNVSVQVTDLLHIDFALGTSSYNGFYKGVFFTYRRQII